jgi:hypothetical protein
MIHWLGALPPTWKALLVIGGAMSLGAAGTAAGIGMTRLPAKLDTHIITNNAAMARQDTLMRYMDRRVSAIEGSVTMSNCLTLAELQGTPWQNCITVPDVSP